MSDELIGQAVMRLRQSRNLTQQSIADLMRERGFRWSQATVWSVESGERPLRLHEAFALTDGLEADINELRSDVEPRPFALPIDETEIRLLVREEIRVLMSEEGWKP